MAKYKVNVDGKDYEVEIENIGSGNLEIRLGDKKSTVVIEIITGDVKATIITNTSLSNHNSA